MQGGGLFTEESIPGFPGAFGDPESIRARWSAFLSRRSLEGRVVGLGTLLTLPVDIEVTGTGEGDLKNIVLVGQNSVSVTLQAHALAVPKYRKQVTFIRLERDGTVSFRSFAYMAPIHVRLLERVWKELEVKKGRCIHKSVFDRITAEVRVRRHQGSNMTDGPRRWRELRNEYGFDVSVEGEYYCAGESRVPVREPNVRPETDKMTEALLPVVAPDTPRFCAKCGAEVSFEGDERLVAGALDHRRPVIYGGTDDPSNLQVLCVRCNNLKRTFCERCPLGFSCSVCSWAYPERVIDLIVVSLFPEEAKKFAYIVQKYSGKPPEVAKKLLLEAIENHFKKGD